MSFPAILDVAIGLTVIFFLLATICSTLIEMLSARGKWRHNELRVTVNNLLHDPAAQTAFWIHPEIVPLKASDATSPGYLESARFAAVVLDLATGQGQEGLVPNTRAAFAHAFDIHAPNGLKARLRSLMRGLPTTTTDVRGAITAAIAQWYDEAMARTTGKYKRRVQKNLFIAGLMVAVVLNCDTARIGYVLYRNPGLRSAMVDYAKTIDKPADAETSSTANVTKKAESVAPAETTEQELRKTLRTQIKELQALERLGFPIGWVAPFHANFVPPSDDDRGAEWWLFAYVLKIGGVLLTAFAVCLGAPFWFDVLNKISQLRNAGQKPAADSASSSGSAGGATPTPGPKPTGPTSPATVAAAAVVQTPLPSLFEALRSPNTQFQTAKAYWLAEAAQLAYADDAEVERKVKGEWRFDKVVHFADAPTNTEGFFATGSGVAILSFRGTEPKQLRDWLTDAQAKLRTLSPYAGNVHTGFSTAMESMLAPVRKELAALPGSGTLLYVTGHSLGAALATLAAYQIAKNPAYPIQGVYTYGSPRVGDLAFTLGYQALVGPATYRIVNNEDLVTRVAPRAAGYEHVGEMIYIDETGKLQRDIGFWYRFLNFVANAAESFEEAAKTTVRDHSMTLYCEHLRVAATTQVV